MTEKIYKINEIGCKNFAKFKSFKCSLDDYVTYFCGHNGAGKSTAALDVVWTALTGIGLKNTNDNLIGDKFQIHRTGGKVGNCGSRSRRNQKPAGSIKSTGK